jgi:MFS family permease
MNRIGKESINYGVKNLSIRYLMIVSFIFSSFMMWGWYAWQPYFLKLYGDPNAVWIAGVISAALALSEALGSLVIGIINSKFKRRTSMMFIFYGIQALSIIAIGFANSFWIAVGAFLCFSFTVGLIMPIKQSYLHKLIPSEHRATIVSFDSLIGSTGSVIGQTGYGYLAEKISIGSGYIVGGVVNILILPVLILLNRRNDKEDLVK